MRCASVGKFEEPRHFDTRAPHGDNLMDELCRSAFGCFSLPPPSCAACGDSPRLVSRHFLSHKFGPSTRSHRDDKQERQTRRSPMHVNAASRKKRRRRLAAYAQHLQAASRTFIGQKQPSRRLSQLNFVLATTAAPSRAPADKPAVEWRNGSRRAAREQPATLVLSARRPRRPCCVFQAARFRQSRPNEV